MFSLQNATARFFLLLLLGFTLSPPLMAAARHYTIAAQPLSVALSDFSRQSGLQVSLDARLAWNKVSSPVDGQFTAEEAIELLLQGTGLEWRKGAGDTLLILDPQPTRNAILLPSLRITGEASVQDLPYQTPGSVNVLTQRDIERFRGTSVGDIFQGTAGVLVGENRNSGGLDVNIRGMQGQGRVPVLVDGARQETTVYRGYAGVASRSYVDPDLIGGIRIDKGPVMTAEGTGATGGVVSMRTINASDIVKDGKDWGIRLRGSLIGNNTGSPVAAGTKGGYMLGTTNLLDDNIYRTDCGNRPDICNQRHSDSRIDRTYALPDSFSSEGGFNRPGLLQPKSYAGSLALAKRFDWGDLVAAYAQRSQGNYYAGKNGPTPWLELVEVRRLPLYTEVKPRVYGASRFRAEELIINSNYESESLLLKGQFFLPQDQTWELSYLRYDSEYSELMPSQLLWYGHVTQTENSTVIAHTYTSRYHWNPAAWDWLNLRFNLWHTDTTSLNRNYSEDMDGGFAPEAETELYQRWGGDLSNSMDFYAWGQTTLNYGLAVQDERARPKDRAVRHDWEVPTASSYLRDAERAELSAFVALQQQLPADLTLEAGVRYTRFSTKDHNPATLNTQAACEPVEGTNECRYDPDYQSSFCVDEDGDGKCDPIYSENSDSGFAPLIALTWEPWQGIQLYARYAEALRMPSLFETSGGFSQQPALEINLRPEHTRNKELGLNILRQGLLTADDKFRLKLAYFRNYTKDYLTRTSSNNWEEGNGFMAMRNIKSASFHGAELSVDYDLGRVFSEISGTRYNLIETCHVGSYRREVCTDYGIANSYINNMIPPPWHASALLGTRWFGETLELGVRGTFMSQRNIPEYDNDTNRGLNAIVPWHKYTLLDFFATWQPNDWLTLDFNIDNLTDEYYLDALSLGLVPAPGRTARLSLTLQF